MRVPASDEWYLCCWLVHCLPASIEQQRSNMIPSISILQVNNGGNRSKANQGNQINWAVIVNQRASWRWPNYSPRDRQKSGKRYDPHLASELDLHTADRLNLTCHSNRSAQLLRRRMRRSCADQIWICELKIYFSMTITYVACWSWPHIPRVVVELRHVMHKPMQIFFPDTTTTSILLFHYE